MDSDAADIAGDELENELDGHLADAHRQRQLGTSEQVCGTAAPTIAAVPETC